MSTTLAPDTVITPLAPATEVGEILEGCAEEIEQNGWFKASPSSFWHARGKRTCAAYAIDSSTTDASLRDRVLDHFGNHLGFSGTPADKALQIVRWNDQQGDERDVTRVLREAAATAL